MTRRIGVNEHAAKELMYENGNSVKISAVPVRTTDGYEFDARYAFLNVRAEMWVGPSDRGNVCEDKLDPKCRQKVFNRIIKEYF